MGLKLLLPIELAGFVEKEDRDFYQRARLDKQNMVPSLEWTGQSLYDLANARVAACAAPGATPKLRDLFDDSIDDTRLIDAFSTLRVPRHLFKFLYRMLAAHCQQYVETQPAWKIAPSTFETQLALYRRDQRRSIAGWGRRHIAGPSWPSEITASDGRAVWLAGRRFDLDPPPFCHTSALDGTRGRNSGRSPTDGSFAMRSTRMFALALAVTRLLDRLRRIGGSQADC